MFQSLRPNSTIYILHKNDNPKMEIGYVSSISSPKPRYQIPSNFGQTQEFVVDIVAKINGQFFNYNNIPAQLDIADSFSNGETLTISDNKAAMNSEVINLKQKSIDIIDSVEYNKTMIEQYNNILSELNPEFAEKQAQREEIDILKNQISDMSKNVAELMDTNRKLIERLSLKSN